MAAISQTTLSNAFSWMKMLEFRYKFHWILFLKEPINNIPVLIQMMAWRLPGDKPLSEPMMVSLLTHICLTQPQWVNRALRFMSFWVNQDDSSVIVTSQHRNSFRVTGPLWGEWIPLTKGQWCIALMFSLLLAWIFCWTNNQIEMLVIWDTVGLMWHHCNELYLDHHMNHINQQPYRVTTTKQICVGSWRWSCLVNWFCYQLIAKPGNKTAAPPWPDPQCAQGGWEDTNPFISLFLRVSHRTLMIFDEKNPEL